MIRMARRNKARNRKLAVVPILAAAAAVLTLAACSTRASADDAAPTSGPLRVVASTSVWGNLAASVGGKHVQVTSIIDSPDKDPHDYAASAQNQLALSKAAVVIENGGGYDDFVASMLAATKSDSRIVLNAVTISGKKADAGAGSNEPELNEHVWYDLPTVQKVIDRMKVAFAKEDPKNAAEFATNAAELKKRLGSLEQRERDLKSRYAGNGASITEPVPLYMLNAIGLVDKTPEKFSEAIENDSDVAPSVLQKTIQLYSSHAVALLAYNKQTTGSQTDAVLKAAKAAGVPVVPMTETLPAGKNYVSWMSANLDAISAALEQSALEQSAPGN